jgi:hypothetical protein
MSLGCSVFSVTSGRVDFGETGLDCGGVCSMTPISKKCQLNVSPVVKKSCVYRISMKCHVH